MACGFLGFLCAAGREACRGTDHCHDAAAAANSLGIRTKLYAAVVKVNIQPTGAVPRWRVLRRPPVVLIQPNTSSNFVAEMRRLGVTPYVTQNTKGR